jgi:hypothetical protein
MPELGNRRLPGNEVEIVPAYAQQQRGLLKYPEVSGFGRPEPKSKRG